jgi:3-oxoacyl-[acyl-carrier-protein] synthase-3
MLPVAADLSASVLSRLHQVRQELGLPALAAEDPETPLADLLDSMALVELLAALAEDHGLSADAIERAAGRRFSTVASLAAALAVALREQPGAALAPHPVADRSGPALCRMTAPRLRLPLRVQESDELDALLGRPAGWLRSHAGIARRYVWGAEDAVSAAAETARESLAAAGVLPDEVGALLATSQAPPLATGLSAALHRRIDLPPRAVALEIGGACTGFLQALWLASRLAAEQGVVLIVAVEAPSCHLIVEPGGAGEAAALFGDAAAACVVGRDRLTDNDLSLLDVRLATAGDPDGLLAVEGDGRSGLRVRMDGPRLAGRAVELLAGEVREAATRQGVSPRELDAVIAHAGNGRMPAVLARALGVSGELMLSLTAESGNLASASLAAAWAANADKVRGRVAWAAVGAGLTVASAFTQATARQ